jgi:hypothetical protein
MTYRTLARERGVVCCAVEVLCLKANATTEQWLFLESRQEKYFAAENKKDVEKFRARGFTSTQGIILFFFLSFPFPFTFFPVSFPNHEPGADEGLKTRKSKAK